MRDWDAESRDGGKDFDGSFERAWVTCLGCMFRYRLYETPCPVCWRRFGDELIEWEQMPPSLLSYKDHD